MVCPNCGNNLEEGALFCFKCGMQLGTTASQPVQQSVQQPVQGGGYDTGVAGNDQSMQPAPKKKNTLLVVAIIIVVLMVLGVIGMVVYNRYESKQIEAEWDAFERAIGIDYLKVDGVNSDSSDMPQGVLVEEVVSSGVAEKAGIEAGDIITRFAGVNVTGEYELLREVLSHNLGDTVDIAIERKQDGEYMEIEGTITLGEGGSLSLTVSEEEAADAEDAKDEGADDDASSAFATGLFDRVAPPEDLDVLTGVLEDYYKCKSERNVEKSRDHH